MRRLLLLSLFVLTAAVAGCRAFESTTAYKPVRQSDIIQTSGVEQRRTVYIVSNGWHAGLILPTSDINLQVWPESKKWKTYEYLEVGWGDSGFYRAKRVTPWLVIDAAMIPSAGVLHLVGSDGAVTENYQGADLVELSVSPEAFDRLCEFVHDTYSRDKYGDAKYLGPGLYGVSAFYQTDELYYFPKTCNVWTARALSHAGLPVEPALSTTAGGLVRRARQLGTTRSRLAGLYNPFASPDE